MRNNVKAYKVCRHEGNKTVSWTSSSYEGRSVEYQVGKLTRPHPDGNQFLFVFRTLGAAKSFVQNDSSNFKHTFYEVRAHNCCTFFRTYENHLVLADYFPSGTMFCSSMRVIKKL